MKINFDSINNSYNQTSFHPRDLFMALPNKNKSYSYPRDVQTEVWNQWFDNRNEKNNIIKMNTGSGKTVVGLMILKSCLLEGIGPAVYVVPDNYLVNQVVEEAGRIGIKVTKTEDDWSVILKEQSTNTQKSGRIKMKKPERENDYEVQ